MFKKGHIPWNKGKTKETDIRIKKAIQKMSELIGEKNPYWKGGNKNYWGRESRKAWEKYHGRKKPPGGLIHHKDKNKKNIDPKNLELILAQSGQLKDSQGKHIKWHATLRKLKKRTNEFLNKKIM